MSTLGCDRSEGDEELDTVSSANPPMHRLRKLAESLLAMSFYVAIFGLVVAALSQIATTRPKIAT